METDEEETLRERFSEKRREGEREKKDGMVVVDDSPWEMNDDRKTERNDEVSLSLSPFPILFLSLFPSTVHLFQEWIVVNNYESKFFNLNSVHYL